MPEPPAASALAPNDGAQNDGSAHDDEDDSANSPALILPISSGNRTASRWVDDKVLEREARLIRACLNGDMEHFLALTTEIWSDSGMQLRLDLAVAPDYWFIETLRDGSEARFNGQSYLHAAVSVREIEPTFLPEFYTGPFLPFGSCVSCFPVGSHLPIPLWACARHSGFPVLRAE